MELNDALVAIGVAAGGQAGLVAVLSSLWGFWAKQKIQDQKKEIDRELAVLKKSHQEALAEFDSDLQTERARLSALESRSAGAYSRVHSRQLEVSEEVFGGLVHALAKARGATSSFRPGFIKDNGETDESARDDYDRNVISEAYDAIEEARAVLRRLSFYLPDELYENCETLLKEVWGSVWDFMWGLKRENRSRGRDVEHQEGKDPWVDPQKKLEAQDEVLASIRSDLRSLLNGPQSELEAFARPAATVSPTEEG